jgi:ABC-type Mn2+/Zn2+ transport system permease subunit
MTLWSVAIGVVSVAGGMVLSYVIDLPPGPVIVLWQSAVFLIALAVGKWLKTT